MSALVVQVQKDRTRCAMQLVASIDISELDNEVAVFVDPSFA